MLQKYWCHPYMTIWQDLWNGKEIHLLRQESPNDISSNADGVVPTLPQKQILKVIECAVYLPTPKKTVRRLVQREAKLYPCQFWILPSIHDMFKTDVQNLYAYTYGKNPFANRPTRCYYAMFSMYLCIKSSCNITNKISVVLDSNGLILIGLSLMFSTFYSIHGFRF